MATLFLKNGDCIELQVKEEALSIGRTPSNPIQIDHDSVSRLHARIGIKDRKFFVSDNGSTNGTFLNGKVLPAKRNYWLEDGDLIRFGDFEVVFANSSGATMDAYRKSFDKKTEEKEAPEAEIQAATPVDQKFLSLQQKVKQAPPQKTATKTNLNYASWGRRFASAIVDGLISAIPTAICSVILIFSFGSSIGSSAKQSANSFNFLGTAVQIACGYLYFVGLVHLLKKGQTPAKMLFKLRILNANGEVPELAVLAKRLSIVMLVTYIGPVLVGGLIQLCVSLNPIALTTIAVIATVVQILASIGLTVWGFIVFPIRDPQKRALHDKLSGTVVVYEG